MSLPNLDWRISAVEELAQTNGFTIQFEPARCSLATGSAGRVQAAQSPPRRDPCSPRTSS